MEQYRDRERISTWALALLLSAIAYMVVFVVVYFAIRDSNIIVSSFVPIVSLGISFLILIGIMAVRYGMLEHSGLVTFSVCLIVAVIVVWAVNTSHYGEDGGNSIAHVYPTIAEEQPLHEITANR